MDPMRFNLILRDCHFYHPKMSLDTDKPIAKPIQMFQQMLKKIENDIQYTAPELDWISRSKLFDNLDDFIDEYKEHVLGSPWFNAVKTALAGKPEVDYIKNPRTAKELIDEMLEAIEPFL